MARHFKHKAEVFFKETILDGPLEKTQDYAIRIEFQFKKVVAGVIYSNR